MEARRTVARWYSEREEVRHWQYNCKQDVSVNNRVHTLLGRTCLFPLMHNRTGAQKANIARAAISTVVQGSAGDVAMFAMLEISKNACLKELGWRLLLQVYDEVMLGPTELAAVAKAIVLDCMSKPFDGENILELAYLLMPNELKTGTLPNVCYVATQLRVLYIRNPHKGTTYQKHDCMTLCIYLE